ncbi:ankyrin repeat domain-containing protein [Parashewanella tropica]|uniref:ankyrin repeat domain-containing protein n=1 Tax=Parashewanella tropica TaxID=2547970 RepID=UPI00105A7339|nr:ankyrin repeat domain-containing protein [Parashewanella tropica]
MSFPSAATALLPAFGQFNVRTQQLTMESNNVTQLADQRVCKKTVVLTVSFPNSREGSIKTSFTCTLPDKNSQWLLTPLSSFHSTNETNPKPVPQQYVPSILEQFTFRVNSGKKLFHAAQQGDLATVNKMLSEGADTGYLSNNLSAVEVALENGFIATASRLIKVGVSPEVATRLLQKLVTLGDYGQCVEELLKQGGDPNATNEQGESLLYIASQRGFVNSAIQLLKRDADIGHHPQTGENALHLAAANGSYILLQALARKYPTQINSRTNSGLTPLLLAIEHGNTDCASHLIESGADINAADNYQRTPLIMATKFHLQGVIIKLFQKHITAKKALETAEASKKPALQANILDINKLTTHRKSALCYSVGLVPSRGPYVMDLLLQHGACIAHNPETHSPIVLAISAGSGWAVNSLLKSLKEQSPAVQQQLLSSPDATKQAPIAMVAQSHYSHAEVKSLVEEVWQEVSKKIQKK